jgi:hypothetical protein
VNGKRAWTPRPDPALREPLPPGLRPHRHKPDHLYGWVFLQHQVWVDYWGNEHEIESMASDYVRNVIGFCQQRTERIFVVASCELLYRLGLVLAGVGAPPARELIEACFPPDRDLAGVRPQLGDWLERLPLLQALRQRLASLQNGCAS